MQRFQVGGVLSALGSKLLWKCGTVCRVGGQGSQLRALQPGGPSIYYHDLLSIIFAIVKDLLCALEPLRPFSSEGSDLEGMLWIRLRPQTKRKWAGMTATSQSGTHFPDLIEPRTPQPEIPNSALSTPRNGLDRHPGSALVVLWPSCSMRATTDCIHPRKCHPCGEA